jgi:copper(I)-binding protein
VKRLLTLIAVLAVIAGACGGSGDVEVSDVWARTSARTQNAGAVYLTMSGGDEADRLVSASVSSSVAGAAQVHETTMDSEGTMMMQEVAGIDIPADGEVMLKPGSFHVMLMMLAEPLVTGEEFDVTLTFQNAGDITVTAEVREN